MIRVIPAIDLMAGRCVRLVRGDFARRTDYETSPSEIARSYHGFGFPMLHVVDLDGARAGRVEQLQALREILATGVAVQFGGGLQSRADLQSVFAAGATRAVVGSAAATRPEEVFRWIEEFGAERIVIAADSLESQVQVDAWRTGTSVEVHDLLRQFREHGARWALCTDVAKDGEMMGPSVSLYDTIRREVPGLGLIASGGVRSRDDVVQLNSIGVEAVVIGKALLDGAVSPEELVEFTC